MSTLERAIEIAATAHLGQSDKAGAPYICHPFRVALEFIRAGDEQRAIVAILHDVIEDTPLTAEDLSRDGFEPEIIDAVVALTRRDDEEYAAFVRRAAANGIARPVKIADLRDNLAETRMAKLPSDERRKLLAKYAGALAFLGVTP